MNYWIGTSGFQYPEWKDKFYPADLPASKMLAYFGSHFSSTEINYTFRHLPSEKAMLRWVDETPSEFKFSFKAPQRVTHFSKLRDCGELMRVFNESLALAGLKGGPVLFQLPPNFVKDAELLRTFLDELPARIQGAIEFRHASWFDDEIYRILKRFNVALCVAESEDLKTPEVATANFGYLRLRREDYTAAQIKRWAKWIEAQSPAWSETYVYFKHEEQAVGPKFAQQMQRLLPKEDA